MARELLLSRRGFLVGCSLAASPLLTPVTFAAAPGQNRLVVIVLRGALDGLDLVRPVGDPAYGALRPSLLKGEGGIALDSAGFFQLHPGAAALMPLWQAGELGFVHAVATPYRSRSHFVGQDVLENGSASDQGTLTPGGDGWLNRALVPLGARQDLAVTVGQEPMLILEGDVPVAHWSPIDDSSLSAQGEALLARLYAEDPLLASAYPGATDLRHDGGAGADVQPVELGAYVAERLRGEARIAAFSYGGWDTHQNQSKVLAKRLGELSETILALKQGLGPDWATTLVVAITEFGRTARENGTVGTDHGTGGAMIFAGGAAKGGRVLGDWPGLGDSALLEDRDLMPTRDVRAYAAWALRSQFGLGVSDLEGVVFPGLDLGADPGLVL
ncbi:DUF1501 domain-containing protein [Tabrizicola sp. J26]|uniref:DUF1501 domain-containing protein n=1 Tax=Alitabrizicola rongguiensis TaxID=2909234 RepID=UPI001F36665C|nr:DUF1501 domain-containing protein [Tabrizicola rongguiensis]MCF1708447.1 DUF1501 domain-containing protein [Tabrizicola rongguiensis]